MPYLAYRFLPRLIPLWLAIVFFGWGASCAWVGTFEPRDTFAKSSVLTSHETPPDPQKDTPSSVFRYTKNGWEDSSLWYVPPSPPRSPLMQFHPLLWALLVLLMVLIGLFSVSKEDEVNRFIGEFDIFLKTRRTKNANDNEQTS